MKTLLIDIETAPNIVYTWDLFNQNIGLNQIVQPGYTLCFAAEWLDKPKTTFRSVFHHGEEAMLQKAHEMLSEADAVVHYNGKRFDIPKLNGEFLRHDMPPPPPPYQIDLYHTVKQNFKLASHKLDFVATHLGVEGKVHHKGMPMWSGCMNGVKADWKIMKEYNIEDVRLLKRVYPRLLPWIKNGPNLALYSNGTEAICSSCGSDRLQKRGFYKTHTMTYQRFQCQACGSWSRARTNNLSKEEKQRVLVKI